MQSFFFFFLPAKFFILKMYLFSFFDEFTLFVVALKVLPFLSISLRFDI